MLEIFQALILGVVQGLTEFLPISSTAHLIIVPWLFGWDGIVSTLSFDLALHIGTTVAVVGFFWRDWARLAQAFLKNLPLGFKKIWAEAESRLFLLLVIGSLPAAIVGAVFDDFVENSFRGDITLIASMVILFAFVLYWLDSKKGKRKIEHTELKDALIVGFSQVVALIPGVSRSGITISAGLFQGLDRQSATRFSFLLSTPIIVGASLFKFKDIVGEGGLNDHLGIFVAGSLAAAVSGWLSIKFLLDFLQKNNFKIFIVYRVILGLVLFSLVFLR